MKHIDKIQLFNKENNEIRLPNADGKFFIHYITISTLYGVRTCPVWDNQEYWAKDNNFIFVPAVIQHFFGELDKFGNDVYTGDVMVLEVSNSNAILQDTIWNNSLYFDEKKVYKSP